MTAHDYATRAISRRATELGLPDFTTDDADSLADAVLSRLSAAGLMVEEQVS